MSCCCLCTYENPKPQTAFVLPFTPPRHCSFSPSSRCPCPDCLWRKQWDQWKYHGLDPTCAHYYLKVSKMLGDSNRDASGSAQDPQRCPRCLLLCQAGKQPESLWDSLDIHITERKKWSQAEGLFLAERKQHSLSARSAHSPRVLGLQPVQQRILVEGCGGHHVALVQLDVGNGV